jgi:hypothetical protein
MTNGTEYFTENQKKFLYLELGKIKTRKNFSCINLLKMKKSNLQLFFNNNTFKMSFEDQLSETDSQDLINKHIIKIVSEKEKTATISFKGLILLEYGILNFEKSYDAFLNDIDSNYFGSILESTHNAFEAREKAIITFMLGTGAISQTYSVRVDENNMGEYKKAVDMAADFLYKNGFDDGTLKKLWTREIVGLDPAISEFQRLDKICVNTEGIYRKPPNSGHYLDIFNDDKIDKKNLVYLIKKIFEGKPISYDERQEYLRCLDDIKKKFGHAFFAIIPPYNYHEYRRLLREVIELEI